MVEEATDYMDKMLKKLKDQFSNTTWTHYTTGHSLGAFVSNACQIQFDDDLEQ